MNEVITTFSKIFWQSRSGKTAAYQYWLWLGDNKDSLRILYKEEKAPLKRIIPPRRISEKLIEKTITPAKMDADQRIAYKKLLEAASLTIIIDGDKKYRVEKTEGTFRMSPKIVIKTDYWPEAYLLVETRESLKSGIAAYLQEDSEFMRKIPVVVDTMIGRNYDWDVFWEWLRKEVEPRINNLELSKIELSPELLDRIRQEFGYKKFMPLLACNLNKIWRLLDEAQKFLVNC